MAANDMTQGVTPPQLAALEGAAREASRHAYAPYSGFAVGAAVLADSGTIYTGCNVENASYGLTNCAERTAIFTAAAHGERLIRAVAVFTPTAQVTPPCGACRQVINEFGPECVIVSCCESADRIVTTAAELLPGAFGPKNLRDR